LEGEEVLLIDTPLVVVVVEVEVEVVVMVVVSVLRMAVMGTEDGYLDIEKGLLWPLSHSRGLC
jgi:hypothetical protein